VSITKSARARFSSSGICRARIASSFRVMPGRASTRSRCTSAGAETTMTLSNSFAAGLEQQRDFEQQRRRIAMLGDEALARGADRGVDDRSSAASSSGSPSTICASSIAIERAAATCPESARRSLDQRAARALQPRTTASASNTGTPARSNILATVDLPMPIEPVSAIRIMRQQPALAQARRAAGSAACRGS
jgi:hypothetical protein